MRTLFAFATLILLIVNGLQAQNGLVGQYYDGKNFDRLVATRTDAKLSFYWKKAPMRDMNPESFSVRWKGQIQAPKTGVYKFSARVDDGLRVKVNGQSVIDEWDLNNHVNMSGEITLQAGQLYNLEVEYFNGLREGELKLYWQIPDEAPLAAGETRYETPIDEKYFYQPGVTLKPVEKPKPAVKPKAPKPEPAKPAVTTTVVKKVPPAVKPNPDSLKRFIPKDVLFEQSKAIIMEVSKPELDQLAEYLIRHPEQTVRIEGHTDNMGDSESNLSLSKKRAQSVARYLTSKGVDATRITTEGYGDTRPVVKSQPGQPTPANRRVAFIIE
jgi:outer membrane protein OmpA-like peptidoglycan-associated protein